MRAVSHLKSLLLDVLAEKGLEWPEKANIEPPKDKKFGDLATNFAMVAAKSLGMNPRELATMLQKSLMEKDPSLERVEVAGPGFLNVAFTPAFWRETALEILGKGEAYGQSDLGAGRKIQVEFVSANPTGPLHIGHGRGAAVGDCLARILRAAGFEVETEYYINDAGRQMRLLGESTWVRYQELHGIDVVYPEDWYKGEYIIDLAKDLTKEKGGALLSLSADEARGECQVFSMNAILEGIKKDLAEFRVHHDVWFSEKSLVTGGAVEKTLADLRERKLAYDKDGALWFATEQFGDDKDRVLRKSSGELTYFASDIAYHDDKFRRGFDVVVDIWGADHHGYIPRMQAGVEALGKSRDSLRVILVQLVNLLRGGEQIAMSTRAGQFETLADVVSEVGVDAARFMFLSRKSDSPLDFDLELVKEKSMENPVYYVQYAHARICSVLAKAEERGTPPEAASASILEGLDTEEDLALLRLLEQFPDVTAGAALNFSPHGVSFYLRELAGALHRYYSVNPVLTAGSPELVQARLQLLMAVATVLKNGLALLGVEAPRKM